MYALKRIAAYADRHGLGIHAAGRLDRLRRGPVHGADFTSFSHVRNAGGDGFCVRRADPGQRHLDRTDRAFARQVHHVLERERRRRRPSRHRSGYSARDHQGRLAGLLLRHDLCPSRPGHARADLLRRLARPRRRGPETLRPVRDPEKLAEVPPRTGQDAIGGDATSPIIGPRRTPPSIRKSTSSHRGASQTGSSSAAAPVARRRRADTPRGDPPGSTLDHRDSE